jgi:hypothetical protein
MRQILTGAFLLASCTVVSAPAEAQARLTCSSLRAFCDAGVASRGMTAFSQCPAAYQSCLKTGVWQTHGWYGRRVEGVIRR